jgi:hypothetical protein
MTVDTQQLDEAFLDLTLADDELMRAEFDALISASWESPCEPPVDRPCPSGGGHPARLPSRRVRPGARALGPELSRRVDGQPEPPTS